MAHRPSNRQRSRWAVALLDVRPADRVLEIGFGPGVAIAELARAGAGHVYGVDHSAVMLRQASKRNAAAIRAGRVTLVNASVDRLPPALDGPFDAILAVNSLGFCRPGRAAGRAARAARAGRADGHRVTAPVSRGHRGHVPPGRRRHREPAREPASRDLSTRILPLDPPAACVLAVSQHRPR